MSKSLVGFKDFYAELLRLTGRTNNLGQLQAEKYREIVRNTLYLLAESSPQWSGYFASNWRVKVTGVSRTSGDIGYQQEAYAEAASDQFKSEGEWGGNVSFSPDTIKQRGDQEAIDFCMEANEPVIEKIKSPWARVSFHNDTEYGKYIAKNTNEEGKSPYLRAINYTDPTPIPIGYVKARLPELLK